MHRDLVHVTFGNLCSGWVINFLQTYFVVRPYIFFNHQQFNLSYGFHSSSDTHSSHSIVKPKVSDERYTLKPQLPLSIAWQNDRVFSVELFSFNILFSFNTTL